MGGRENGSCLQSSAASGERVILHSDLNSFFASVEIAREPSLAPYPVAVCGSEEERHGIVLAKNRLAAEHGVRTGETVGTARAKCPGLRTVEPHYDDYAEFSQRAREIYRGVTDLVESFGIDECWLDVSGSRYLFGEGWEIAERLRREIRETLGITVSVGVSFCKVFAKLGSDLKKPDAVTQIPRESFREKIWCLPASALLGVGPAAARRLSERSVNTIGELACTPPELLSSYLGKAGRLLWTYANGLDAAPVSPENEEPAKSVGRGCTPPEDLKTDEEAEALIVGLAMDVCHNLRQIGMAACGVVVAVRDSALCGKEFSAPLPRPTQSALVLAEQAFLLFCRSYNHARPVRSLTVRAIRLTPRGAPRQLDLFEPAGEEDRRLRLCEAVDELRDRFGKGVLVPASTLAAPSVHEFGFQACSLSEKAESTSEKEKNFRKGIDSPGFL